MRTWFFRLSALALLLPAFVGCDSNPEGPTGPPANPNAAPAPAVTPAAPTPKPGGGSNPGGTAPAGTT